MMNSCSGFWIKASTVMCSLWCTGSPSGPIAAFWVHVAATLPTCWIPSGRARASWSSDIHWCIPLWGGRAEGQRGACAGPGSDLPSRLSACRSTLWPLGPCCSTCTQVAWMSVWNTSVTVSVWPSSASYWICSTTWRPSARKCLSLGDLGELPFPFPDGFNSCPDVCFQVEGCSFLCHKAFFCGRSDYFRALLDDHFRENEGLEASGGLPAITLHGLSPHVFTHVLYYIYTNHTEVPPEVAYDVLSMADMYLLPGLKRLCGRSLAQLLDEDSVVGLWRVAKLFRLARLEDQCTEYMAKVIEKLVEQEDFSEAVREEAAAVRGRQEQDSIPLVDDIRFHITSVVQTYSNIKEMERRLHALEDLLVSIGLDC
ncbi:PREDICTED: ankyrin repeat and BTB/POZ domain-containing protein 1 isoform X1 [Myotis brandtii]|uniref:ankyrin repeat and BTB/POZ domain-containing protein 1 isoform X1 n=1 Tax=Myotis brandtii TaxID=109478 RepID=UPI0007047919|nr:PREDICTED: ankyrin repeat and BTB/POZ domain-containing protein 1 isoform X1 [Myotis brandtii]